MHDFNIYYNSNNYKIFYLEGAISDEFILQLDDSCFVFYQFTWNVEYKEEVGGLSTLERHISYRERQFSKLNALFNVRKQLIFCAPTEATNRMILESGFTSILLNHNCLFY